MHELSVGIPPEVFTVSRGPFSVTVVAEQSEVRELITSDLGGFFDVRDGAGDRPVAQVAALIERDPQIDISRERPITLHSGSHSYDLRRGWDCRDPSGSGVVASYDTGSLYRIDALSRNIRLSNSRSAIDLATDVRRLIRDQLYVPYMESKGGVTYHSSAFCIDGVGFLVCGGRGAGKTSVFVAALERVASLRGQALGSERNIVSNIDGRLLIDPCPENISFFPGTLRSVKKLQHLAPSFQHQEEWERRAKVRVKWKVLFEALGVAVEDMASSVPLHRVIFPHFDSTLGDTRSMSLCPDETRQELGQHQVTLIDENRPNWLGWFTELDPESTAGNISLLGAERVFWPNINAVGDWLTATLASQASVGRLR